MLDTSVLVPVFCGNHVHHAASLEVFSRFGKEDVCCGAHSLVEVYSVLTRMPGKHRFSGVQGMLIIGDIQERLTVIGLTPDEYFAMLQPMPVSAFSAVRFMTPCLPPVPSSPALPPSSPGTFVTKSSSARRCRPWFGRLPKAVQEQVKLRLANGVRARTLVARLQARPEVQAVLAAEF